MKADFETLIVIKEPPLKYISVNVPPAVSALFKEQKIKRLIASFNSLTEKHCALMPHGDGRDYIIINNEELKTLGLSLGDMVHVCLRQDDSKYGMTCPKEFEELLKQDPEGESLFHALSPGLQRSILHIIAKPKGSETRIKKGLVALEYLKVSGGQFDFRAYNEAYKNFRF